MLIQRFLKIETASGILLLTAALVALIWANSSYSYLHQQFLEKFLFTINEGLMAFFFLNVGLEMKSGYLTGQLSTLRQIALPGIAALGGMVVPALLYGAINYQNPSLLRGWAIPVATDIAFALGVLAIFGRRIPTGLKLFLLALAIFDDLGAIIIIALFYSHDLSLAWLGSSVLVFGLLMLLNKKAVPFLSLYLLLGVVLWISLWKGGIHPTISGFILALTVPSLDNSPESPLDRLETILAPCTAFFIMPIFALANAGFSLQGFSLSHLTDPLIFAIVAGLFIGKQLGVFTFSWIAVKSGLADLPERTSWFTLYGVALLCGIGFTMSLFLGTLAFQSEDIYLDRVRLGVIVGSVLSGLIGAIILQLALARNRSSLID